jgi:hypothetical protein
MERLPALLLARVGLHAQPEDRDAEAGSHENEEQDDG